MKVLARAGELEAQGKKIVHMEVGEPDFVTAEPIRERGKEALDKGFTQYTNAAGIEPLRESIAEFYSTSYNIDVPSSCIFVTPGASGGLSLLANLLINKGDGILMADPAYPCNRNFIRLMEGEPQLVTVGSESNFQPTVGLLEQYRMDNTTGLWLASPANPTGTTLARKDLTSLAAWSRKNDFHTIVDEIYQGLHYVDDLPTLLEIERDGFVVNSFSKYFGMTGWRIGWIVVPDEYTDMVNTLAQNLFISASTIAQHAALAAFEPGTIEILEERRWAFKSRRDFLYDALTEIGFSIPCKGEGAFYLFADVTKFSDDSEKFCQRMLEEHGVAITPGSDFGVKNAERYVRFAYTTHMDDLELGVSRLQKALSAGEP